MLMMRALWGPPWRRKKPRKKKPFTGGTRGSAALASGLILLRRRPEASKAIPGTTRAKRSAFARSFGDLALPDLMATASAADPRAKTVALGRKAGWSAGRRGGAGAGGVGVGGGGKGWGVTVEGWCRIRELGAEGRGGLGGIEMKKR